MTRKPKSGEAPGCNMCTNLNGWMTYLTILVLVSLFVVGGRFVLTDSMVIYAQETKPDFIQVFFPVGGGYDEDNSERSALVDNTRDVVRIALPRTSIDHVRIDPANAPGDVVISKIELRYWFNTETYMPSDLLAHTKPIQMIDRFEVTSAGLVIHSTGNDPALELRLKRPSVLLQLIELGILSLIMSIAVFFAIKKLAYLKIGVVNNKVYLLAIPLLASIGVAALFYPGFMSYDTLHALRGARNGVTDSMWPPMVSYVWRLVDLVSVNPSAMHFSQVFVLLLSIVAIVFLFTNKIAYAAAFLLVYLSIPVVLGTVAVIWKDVLMAAFFLSGFAVIESMRLVVANRLVVVLLSMLAVFLIFLGVCSRHNAITGAVPLLFYFAWVLCTKVTEKTLHLWLGAITLGSALTGVIFISKVQLDNYAIPGFVKMSSSNDSFIQSVRVLDVAGASLCVGHNLYADLASNLSLSEIGRLYDPRHINLSADLLRRVGVDSRINEIWREVAIHHPICFFYNKFQMTKYMLGANDGDQFLITAPAIDKNEYGYSLSESSLRDSVVNYIVYSSHFFFFRPWFLYLISMGAFIYMALARSLTAAHLAIFISALLYFAGLVMFGNAADARLLFYTTSVLSMFAFISIFELKKRHK